MSLKQAQTVSDGNRTVDRGSCMLADNVFRRAITTYCANLKPSIPNEQNVGDCTRSIDVNGNLRAWKVSEGQGENGSVFRLSCKLAPRREGPPHVPKPRNRPGVLKAFKHKA